MSTVRNLCTETDASRRVETGGGDVGSFKVGAHADSLRHCAKPQGV